MKLWKKILIAFSILAVIGVGLVAYGIYKIEGTYTEKIVPDMKRYVQMTKEQQDEYIVTHMEKLMMTLNSEDFQHLQKAMNNDPELRQAGIDWGRSICAVFISMSEDIFAELSAEEKVKYKIEAEENNTRGDKFTKLLEQNKIQ